MKWPGPVETNILAIGRTIKGLNMESNQFILKIYKCCKTAKHFVATFDWLKIYRSGHGLYLYSSGNRYKGQYVAGRKVNLVYFLRHNCFGIRFAALRMVFRILIQAIFRRVLVSFGGRLGYTQGRSLSANLSLRKGKRALLLFEKMWTNYCFV